MSTLTASFDSPVASRNDVSAQASGAASGIPNLILRLEATAALAAALAAYALVGEGWAVFAILFLAPDLSMLGYLAGRKFGAATYNAGHSYLLPAVLGALGLTLSHQPLISLALIWVAHIGFDRLLGFGMKYQNAFGHTHLGVGGKAAD